MRTDSPRWRSRRAASTNSRTPLSRSRRAAISAVTGAAGSGTTRYWPRSTPEPRIMTTCSARTAPRRASTSRSAVFWNTMRLLR
ncbi:Uncharacterised protein [Bordetella pertussis]|nr:Uncharacterised protein [Bordetella pertussis]